MELMTYTGPLTEAAERMDASICGEHAAYNPACGRCVNNYWTFLVNDGILLRRIDVDKDFVPAKDYSEAVAEVGKLRHELDALKARYEVPGSPYEYVRSAYGPLKSEAPYRPLRERYPEIFGVGAGGGGGIIPTPDIDLSRHAIGRMPALDEMGIVRSPDGTYAITSDLDVTITTTTSSTKGDVL